MSMLWAIPAVAVVAAVIIALLGMRAVGVAAVELRRSLEHLDEVRVAVAELRAEAAPVRQGLHHHRGS